MNKGTSIIYLVCFVNKYVPLFYQNPVSLPRFWNTNWNRQQEVQISVIRYRCYLSALLTVMMNHRLPCFTFIPPCTLLFICPFITKSDWLFAKASSTLPNVSMLFRTQSKCFGSNLHLWTTASGNPIERSVERRDYICIIRKRE